jgi:hypothetical protein
VTSLQTPPFPKQDGISGYYVALDHNLQFGSAVLYVNGVRQASGAFSGPVGLLYIGGPAPYVLPSCATDGCVSISLQLLTVDGKPMTFKLTNRKMFNTWGVNTVTMQALPGQTAIVPGQSVAIILMADPKGL